MVSGSLLSAKPLCDCCEVLLMLSGRMGVGGRWCGDIQRCCAPEFGPVGGLGSIRCNFCLCSVVLRKNGSSWFAKCCILDMHGGIFPGEEIV